VKVAHRPMYERCSSVMAVDPSGADCKTTPCNHAVRMRWSRNHAAFCPIPISFESWREDMPFLEGRPSNGARGDANDPAQCRSVWP
jgi:hypothetical protein